MTENDRFLLFDTLAEAQARSAQAAADLKNHPELTQYWWETIELANGGGAVVIQPSGSGPYDEGHTLDDGSTHHSLSAKEVANLVPYSMMGDLIPKPKPPG